MQLGFHPAYAAQAASQPEAPAPLARIANRRSLTHG